MSRQSLFGLRKGTNTHGCDPVQRLCVWGASLCYIIPRCRAIQEAVPKTMCIVVVRLSIVEDLLFGNFAWNTIRMTLVPTQQPTNQPTTTGMI